MFKMANVHSKEAFGSEDSDINKFIANTKYIYVSYLDFQAIHYFYKIMNDFI